MAVNNTSPPVISGQPRQGQVLTTSNGEWTHTLDNLSFAYQWLRCDAAGANCVDIVGQTNNTLFLTLADVGSTIRSEVTATESDDPPPPPPPPAGTNKGISYLRFANGELPTSHITDYDNLVISWGGGPGAGASAANRPLVYMSCVSCKPGAGGVFHFGVTLEEARANNWILKDSGGNEVINAGYPSSSIGDLGLAAYQLKWCQNVEAKLNQWGIDGVFIDDFQRASGGICNAVPTKYPSMASWSAACVSFASFVKNYFETRGFYLVYNANGWVSGLSDSDSGGSTLTFWTQLAPHAMALNCEDWMWRSNIPGGVRKEGAGWTREWDGWLRLAELCEDEGIDFSVNCSSTVQNHPVYLIASMLLETQRGTVYWTPGNYNNYDRNTIWQATFDNLPMGAPSGAKVRVGNSWQRTFANGVVSVDVVNGTATIT